jgi:hypothetical protein
VSLAAPPPPPAAADPGRCNGVGAGILRVGVEEEGLGVAGPRWKPPGATACGCSATSGTCAARASAAATFEEHDVRKKGISPLITDVWGPLTALPAASISLTVQVTEME